MNLDDIIKARINGGGNNAATNSAYNTFNTNDYFRKKIAPVVSKEDANSGYLQQLTQENYGKYGVIPNTYDSKEELDKQRAINQSWTEQFGNMLTQAVGAEIVLGTLKGFSDIVDAGINLFKEETNDYTNPVSQSLEKAQDALKEKFTIYRENPSKSFDWGDSGWWFDNAISAASTLSLMIPSYTFSKIPTVVGKIGRAVGKVKVVNRAGELGKETKTISSIINGSKGVTALRNTAKAIKTETAAELGIKNASVLGQTLKETTKIGARAFFSRTAENYQEAREVYKQNNEEVLNFFLNADEEQLKRFYVNHPEFEGKTKEEIADAIAAEGAAETFKNDYWMLAQDFLELRALSSLWKGHLTRGSNAKLRAKALKLKHQAAGLEAPTKSDIILNELKYNIKNPTKTLLFNELGEGFEEGFQGIQSDKGMSIAKSYIDPTFKPKDISDYIHDDSILEQAFWGVMGAMIFQGSGIGFRKASNAIENRILENKYKKGKITEDEYNRFKNTEEKRRAARLEENYAQLQDLISTFESIDKNINPNEFEIDENGNIVTEVVDGKTIAKHKTIDDSEKDMLKEQAVNAFFKNVTINAVDNDIWDLFRDMAGSEEFEKFYQENGLNDYIKDKPFRTQILEKMDRVHDLYTTALKKVVGSVDGTNNYAASLVAQEIVNRELKLDDLQQGIDNIETEIAKHEDNSFITEEYHKAQLSEIVNNTIKFLDNKARKLGNERREGLITKKEYDARIKELDTLKSKYIAAYNNLSTGGLDLSNLNIGEDNVGFLAEFNKFVNENANLFDTSVTTSVENALAHKHVGNKPSKYIQNLVLESNKRKLEKAALELDREQTNNDYQSKYDSVVERMNKYFNFKIDKAKNTIESYLRSARDLDEAINKLNDINNVPSTIKEAMDELNAAEELNETIINTKNKILRERQEREDARRRSIENGRQRQSSANDAAAQAVQSRIKSDNPVEEFADKMVEYMNTEVGSEIFNPMTGQNITVTNKEIQNDDVIFYYDLSNGQQSKVTAKELIDLANRNIQVGDEFEVTDDKGNAIGGTVKYNLTDKIVYTDATGNEKSIKYSDYLKYEANAAVDKDKIAEGLQGQYDGSSYDNLNFGTFVDIDGTIHEKVVDLLTADDNSNTIDRAFLDIRKRFREEFANNNSVSQDVVNEFRQEFIKAVEFEIQVDANLENVDIPLSAIEAYVDKYISIKLGTNEDAMQNMANEIIMDMNASTDDLVIMNDDVERFKKIEQFIAAYLNKKGKKVNKNNKVVINIFSLYQALTDPSIVNLSSSDAIMVLTQMKNFINVESQNPGSSYYFVNRQYIDALLRNPDKILNDFRRNILSEVIDEGMHFAKPTYIRSNVDLILANLIEKGIPIKIGYAPYVTSDGSNGIPAGMPVKDANGNYVRPKTSTNVIYDDDGEIYSWDDIDAPAIVIYTGEGDNYYEFGKIAAVVTNKDNTEFAAANQRSGLIMKVKEVKVGGQTHYSTPLDDLFYALIDCENYENADEVTGNQYLKEHFDEVVKLRNYLQAIRIAQIENSNTKYVDAALYDDKNVMREIEKLSIIQNAINNDLIKSRTKNTPNGIIHDYTYSYNSLANILFYNKNRNSDFGKSDADTDVSSYETWKQKQFDNYKKTYEIQTQLNSGKKLFAQVIKNNDDMVIAGDTVRDINNKELNLNPGTLGVYGVVLKDGRPVIRDEEGRESPSPFILGSSGFVLNNHGKPLYIPVSGRKKLDTNDKMLRLFENELATIIADRTSGRLNSTELYNRLAYLFGNKLDNFKSQSLFYGYKVIEHDNMITVSKNRTSEPILIFPKKFNNAEATKFYSTLFMSMDDKYITIGNNKSIAEKIVKTISHDIDFNFTFFALNHTDANVNTGNPYIHKQDGKVVITLGGKTLTYNSFAEYYIKENIGTTTVRPAPPTSTFNSYNNVVTSSFKIGSLSVDVKIQSDFSTIQEDIGRKNKGKKVNTPVPYNTRELLNKIGFSDDDIDKLTQNLAGVDISLIPESVMLTLADKNDGAYADYANGEITIYKKGINAMINNPLTLKRLLIHESIHHKFDSTKYFYTNGKLDKNKVNDIYNLYKYTVKALDDAIKNSTGSKQQQYIAIRDKIFANENSAFAKLSKLKRLTLQHKRIIAEEFIAESLSQSPLTEFLNNTTYRNAQGQIEVNEYQEPKSLLEKIFDFIINLFGIHNINNKSILAKEYALLANRNPTIEEQPIAVHSGNEDSITDKLEVKEEETTEENKEEVEEEPAEEVSIEETDENIELFDIMLDDDGMDANTETIYDDNFVEIPDTNINSVDNAADTANNTDGINANMSMRVANMNDFMTMFDNDLNIARMLDNGSISYLCR